MANSKKKHHSTVGRRDFMKMLGVGAGALGLGVAGLMLLQDLKILMK